MNATNTGKTIQPDQTILYGEAAEQILDFFHPAIFSDTAVLIIHGGFWREPDRAGTYAAARALSAAGYLAATMEYRRGPGSWSDTHADVATVVDRFFEFVAGEAEPPRNLVVLGHSAGGQLGLWAASRPSLPDSHGLHSAEPGVTAVIAMAPAADLGWIAEQGIGSGAVEEFVGGADAFPEALPLIDPIRLRPACPVVVLHGGADTVVPAEVSERYVARLREGGFDAAYELVPDAGHLDWVDPASEAWKHLVLSLERLSER